MKSEDWMFFAKGKEGVRYSFVFCHVTGRCRCQLWLIPYKNWKDVSLSSGAGTANISGDSLHVGWHRLQESRGHLTSISRTTKPRGMRKWRWVFHVKKKLLQLVVSWNRGYPQISHFSGIFYYKPTILDSPIYGNPQLGWDLIFFMNDHDIHGLVFTPMVTWGSSMT